MHSRCALLVLLLSLLFLSCGDESTDRYAHIRAFLKFRPVTGVVPLYTAVNSTGMFCTITLGTGTFQFRGSDGQQAIYPYSAEIKSYGQPECVAGFVVGKPSVPDMNLQYPLLAYDLVCPNCYEQSNISRSLILGANQTLTCPRCQRVYDLNNGGVITQGTEGKSLYQYRTCTYSSATDVLVVMN